MDMMEPLEIYDPANGKHLTIYVAKHVAERCRTDNTFAQDLFNKIKDQNVEEGSAIEVETVKSEQEIDDYIIEDKPDKEVWTRRETLKLLKLYQIHESKFKTCKQRKEVWSVISNDLSQFNINRSPEKCAEKWKNLLRTYRSINENGTLNTKFQYYEEIKHIFNNTKFNISEEESNDEIEEKINLDLDENGREHWTKSETLKLIKVYQKYKNMKSTFDKEMQFWKFISQELVSEKVFKTPEKCSTKWKNLFRSYKRTAGKGNLVTKFPYFHQVRDVVNSDDLSQSESPLTLDDADFEKDLDPIEVKYLPEEEDTDMKDGEKEMVSWRANETLRLINAYKRHKHRFGVSPTKKYVWNIISSELMKEGIEKDPEKCESKWKSLIRTYKRGEKYGEPTRFYFYDEINDALNGGVDFNDDEELTTQNDTSVVISKKKSRSNDSDSTYYPDEESDEEDDNLQYEQIIIQTEPAKTDDEVSNIWTPRETSALIRAYATHRWKSESTGHKNDIWKKVTEELANSNIQKSPGNSKRKWANLCRMYKMHNQTNSDAGTFSYYKEMDAVLKESLKSELTSPTAIDNSHQDIVNGLTENKKCKCMQRRELEKQKRHIERMQMLKRKLDIEERKVEAFEKYVKHLRTDS